MANLIRPGLPPLPARMYYLPIDERGYPIPEFVSNLDGKRDFRAVNPEHLASCIRDNVCWICGQRLEALKVFVMGPLPAIQGITNEPPSHVECAEFAARACPFLLLPKAQRRPIDLPNVQELPRASKYNPGVFCLYMVKGYVHQQRPKGIIFQTGRAARVDWYTEGRPATRSEVLAAINSSLPAIGRSGNEEAIERRVAELVPA